MMWTFQRVEEEFDEFSFRQVLGEFNDLMCGYSGESTVNRSGIDVDIWRKLLVRGGLSEEGIAKMLTGEPISQRDTIAAFDPYTVFTVHTMAEGDEPLLTAQESDHVITKILKAQGRVDDSGVRVD